MTKITMIDRHGEERTDLSYADYTPTDNAYPTSRLLSCDNEDCWADQEWEEPGVIKGLKCTAVYLFSKDDICDDNGNEYEEADMFPWDEDHTARIIIDEDQYE